MKPLREVLSLSDQYLEERGLSSSKRIAGELIAFILGKSRLDLYMDLDYPVNEKELERLRAFLQRAGRGEPLEYILESVSFYGCEITVSPDVLIPRVETELLVDMFAKILTKEPSLKGKVLIDLCTGSGCVGISLKKKFPGLLVVLVDISEKALAVAQKNSKRNEVEVELVQSDMLTAYLGKKADFIVCNPPYIGEEEYKSLDSSVKDYEPKLALVGGGSGLELYERLSQEIPSHLVSGGKVLFEIGTGQGRQLQKIFTKAPWKNFALSHDLAGHERFFFLEIE